MTDVEKLRASQARVLAMFRLYGDMTDQQLLVYLRDAEGAAGFKRLMSPSGARSRRSELSKPNEERMRELRTIYYAERGLIERTLGPNIPLVTAEEERAVVVVQRDAAAEWSRRTLAIEGTRSPLWDTGKREKGESGYAMIVWGVAV